MKKFLPSLIILSIFLFGNSVSYATCSAERDPVCGIDGKTYENICTAGKIKIVYKGECIKENGLVESLDKELKNLEKILGKKAVKINNNLEKYKKVLIKKSVKTRMNVNQKVIKKIQYMEDKLFEGQPFGSKLPEKIKNKHNLLRYVELKLQVIQNGFFVKNSLNLPNCDDSNNLNQCKIK